MAHDALHRSFFSRDFESSLATSASILCSTPVSGVTIVSTSDPDGSKGSESFTLSTSSATRDDASLIYLQSCAELKKAVEWDVLQGGSLEVYTVALKAVKAVNADKRLSKHLELAAEVLRAALEEDPHECCGELCEFVEESVDIGFVNAVFGQTGAGSDADAAALFREKCKEKGVTWAPKRPPATAAPTPNPQEQQPTNAREAFGSYSDNPEDEDDYSEDDDDDGGGYPGSVPSYYPSGSSSSSRRPAPSSTTLSRPSPLVAYFQSLRAFLRLKAYPHFKELLAALVMCGGMAAIIKRRAKR